MKQNYIVLHCANLPQSDMPGYRQWFESYEATTDELTDIVSLSVNGKDHPAGRTIQARSGYQAISMFREAKAQGELNQFVNYQYDPRKEK